MRAKPNYHRFLVNLPAELSEWLEAEAQRMTIAGGGLKSEGGKGYFGVSDVLIRLIRAERERETRRNRNKVELRRFAVTADDIRQLRPPDPDHTVCIE